MTRANIQIIQGQFPKKTHLEIGSDAYPESVVPALVTFLLGHVNSGAIYRNDKNPAEVKEKELYDSISSSDLVILLQDTYATIGGVGNFSYAYEVDLVKGTVKAWESGIRWINAPLDWEKRGWRCWTGKNGKAGYTTWVKAKKVFEISIEELRKNDTYTVEKAEIQIVIPS